MNPEVKAKWIAALRSGEYNQGRSRLKNDDNTYCCLGVLCELYRYEHPDTNWELRDSGSHFFLGDNFALPDQVIAWAGLDYTLPDSREIPISGEYTHLSTANDSGVSFEGIAQIIEEQL